MIDVFVIKQENSKTLIDFLHGRFKEENSIFECPLEDLKYYLTNKHCDLLISLENPKGIKEGSRFDSILIAKEVNPNIPVVHILGGDDMSSTLVVRALKSGATDCIRSPFSYEELYYRIVAILSKTRCRTKQKEIVAGDFILEPTFRILKYVGPKTRRPKVEEIPSRECQLLEIFMANPNKVIPRPDILRTCWGRADEYSSRILGAYLAKLRGRLEDDPKLVIEVIRGEGVALWIKEKK